MVYEARLILCQPELLTGTAQSPNQHGKLMSLWLAASHGRNNRSADNRERKKNYG